MSTFHWFRSVSSATVGDVLKGRPPVVSIKTNQTVGHALDMMQRHNLDVLALLDVHDGLEYVGFISILDIIVFLHNDHRSTQSKKIDLPVLAARRTDEFQVVDANNTLFFILAHFFRGNHCALATSDELPQPIMLTQTDIVYYLLDNSSSTFPGLEDILNTEIGAVSRPVTSFLTMHTLVADALPLLGKFHTVPVVSAEPQTIIAELSARDMKGQVPAMVALSADITVESFLRYCNTGAVVAPFVLPASTTLRAALVKMRGVSHRAYINDYVTEQCAIRVMTFTDIIEEIFNRIMPQTGDEAP